MIRALLFDADGVVQHHGSGGRVLLGRLLDCPSDAEKVDEFLNAVSAVEQSALVGQAEFEDLLSEVLLEWSMPGKLEEALAAWTHIELHVHVVEAIRKLRATGLLCCLATNQQRHRATFMSQTLGYGELFDREYYACNIGHKKPDREFFTHIIRDLKLPPDEIAFLDDHASNVEAAMGVGINADVYDAASGTEEFADTLARIGVGGHEVVTEPRTRPSNKPLHPPSFAGG